jgi:spore coat protein CotF
MDLLKSINISSDKLSPNQPFTAVELGKLWATYLGNSMSNRILSYFLKNVEDEHVKTLLENGYNLTVDFMKTIEKFFSNDKVAIPIGFTEEDVNLGAPRLFEDQFYAHYLKYAAKAGLSLYAIAIPLVMREDVREFFIHCNSTTTILLGQINNVLLDKGYIIKAPIIPVPTKVDYIQKENYLNGFFGDVRALHALEITHLYDNIENNITSKALLIGFSQAAKKEKVREYFLKGKEITDKEVQRFQDKLHKENLPFPSQIDHLVTDSTYSPFSDRIMVFHKVDMFSIKIRSFANSMAVNGRRDIGLMYMKSLAEVSLFVEDGANIMIEHGWMEQPPKAIDRESLSSR